MEWRRSRIAPRGGRIATDDVRERIEETLATQWGAPQQRTYVDTVNFTDVYLCRGCSIGFAPTPSSWPRSNEPSKRFQVSPRVLRADQLSDDERGSDREERRAQLMAGRSGDLVVVPKRYWYLGDATRHLRPHMERFTSTDTHVPLIIFGGAIKAARVASPVTPADIAPTFGRLAGVQLSKAEGHAPCQKPFDNGIETHSMHAHRRTVAATIAACGAVLVMTTTTAQQSASAAREIVSDVGLPGIDRGLREIHAPSTDVAAQALRDRVAQLSPGIFPIRSSSNSERGRPSLPSAPCWRSSTGVRPPPLPNADFDIVTTDGRRRSGSGRAATGRAAGHRLRAGALPRAAAVRAERSVLFAAVELPGHRYGARVGHQSRRGIVESSLRSSIPAWRIAIRERAFQHDQSHRATRLPGVSGD